MDAKDAVGHFKNVVASVCSKNVARGHGRNNIMRGSRKFLSEWVQRFLVYVGTEDPAGHHRPASETPLKWRQ